MTGNNITNQKGVTLLELIISIALFTGMILIITQIFTMINEGQRNAIASQNIQESLRYSFETMSKEIRNAIRDNDGTCIGAGKLYETDGEYLSFLNQYSECVIYRAVNSRIWITRGAKGPDFATTDDILIKKLSFIVSEDYQEMVTFAVEAEAVSNQINAQKIIIQSSVSSRNYD